MDGHWLTRASTIRRLWVAFALVLAATVAAQLAVPPEPHFALERLFAFYALYGFLACAAMILAAKAIGGLLKRPERYYEEPGDG